MFELGSVVFFCIQNQNVKKIHNILKYRFEQTPADDISTICQLISDCDVKLSSDVIKQRNYLEEQLKVCVQLFYSFCINLLFSKIYCSM